LLTPGTATVQQGKSVTEPVSQNTEDGKLQTAASNSASNEKTNTANN